MGIVKVGKNCLFKGEMNVSKKVAFYTLGCRLNFSETGELAKGFHQRGYDIVPFGERADVVFINTCTVTDDADSSCRRLIRKAWRMNPEGKIVVAGLLRPDGARASGPNARG